MKAARPDSGPGCETGIRTLLSFGVFVSLVREAKHLSSMLSLCKPNLGMGPPHSLRLPSGKDVQTSKKKRYRYEMNFPEKVVKWVG